MSRFTLSNLDCPSCAASIEDALRSLDAVEAVSLNLQTGALSVRERGGAGSLTTEQVRAAVRSVHPRVSVSDARSPALAAAPANGLRELTPIGVSAVLLVVGLLLGDRLCGGPLHAIEYLILGAAYVICGHGVIAAAGRSLLRGRMFDENFLMTVATLGAIAIHELPEAVGVMLFYQVGEFCQGLSVGRARRSIQALLALRPDEAAIETANGLRRGSPSDVRVGEIMVIGPGERVPLDGIVISGTSAIDTSSLTGEPTPREVGPGESVYAGTINRTGMLRAEVTATEEDSSVARVLALVEEAAGRKARTERFITRFARVYTPIVVGITVLVALLPPLLVPGATFTDWGYRALVVLVVSCPCALVISIPLGYFGGIGGASRRGVLVKGSNYLDALATTDTVVFDKTGTLTTGQFAVTRVAPYGGVGDRELLRLAALAESRSTHPIAQSIREAYGEDVDADRIEEYRELAGQGVAARIDGAQITVGSHRWIHDSGVPHEVCEVPGTVAHVVRDGVWLGYIVISDSVREDAARAVSELRALGVRRLTMLTGDHEESAARVAEELGLDGYRAGLLPGEKLEALETILAEARGTVCFVGDGVNDAPVLSRADVGVAMGGLGSDAAIEAADVVLMTDAPSQVPAAVRVARRTRAIVWQNILGVAGLMTMWLAVFGDVGVALLAVLNASRALGGREA